MKAEYSIGIAIVGLVGIGLAFLFAPTGTDQTPMQKATAQKGTPYTEIVNPSGFVNTEGITLKELVGKKVILVDFLTYSCINCQRTFPYLKAWYEKYKDQGLEIVSIHTPEFAFEKDADNVREAMQRFGITNPVVLDNDYATWNAYGNRYWPRKYLIDINGNVVYDHIGEGAYEETEMKIRELLEERSKVLGQSMESKDDSLATENVPEISITAKSPETYFGSDRNEYLANGVRGKSGEQTFVIPTSYAPNALYLDGTWKIASENAESVSEAKVVYRYNAKEVYIVADADTAIEVEVYQDGELLGASRGADVNASGVVIIKESRLYKIIRNADADEHILELRVKSKGVRFYAFTFG